MFADDEARVLRRWASDDAQLAGWVRRRSTGEPLEYIVGRVEFAGLDLVVGAGVFVPRQRSVLLAEVAVELVADRDGVFVEVCCGIGPIGAVLAAQLPGTPIVLADSDEVALDHARRNVAGALVCHGDLLAAVPSRLRGRVSVIAAVAPYVPDDQAGLLPAEAVDHEARQALFGGPDGLDVVRLLIDDALAYIAPGAVLALEMHRGQVDATTAFAAARGYAARPVVADDGQTAVVILSSDRP